MIAAPPSSRRVDEIFRTTLRHEHAGTDRFFLQLLTAQWMAAAVLALVRHAGSGDGLWRVWGAVVGGGLLNAAPILLIRRRPGEAVTRQAIAVAQMAWSALFLALTDGRTETQFHVFGSLAFLAYYRDWRVLVTAGVVVSGDHLVRGQLWPASLYGSAPGGVGRGLEFVGWVAFEEAVLIRSSLRAMINKRHACEREAALEGVTDRIQREVDDKTRALRASIAQARTLIKVTNVVPWEVDAATLRFTYISSHALSVFGSRLRQDVGAPFDFTPVVIEDRDRVKTQFKALAAGPVGAHLELDFGVETDDGRRLQLRCLVSLHQDDGGPRVLRGIVRDVTAQKTLELELRHAQKLESVGRLAAGVAHEINTPVQFVGDSVHFVRDVMTDLTGLVRRYQHARTELERGGPVAAVVADLRRADTDADLAYALEHLPRALDRALEGLDRVATIVRSMRAFAHPDQHEAVATDLNQAVASTLAIARHEFKFVADVQTSFGDLPPVRCHPGDINQVLLNLVVNAAHAISDVVGDSGARGRIEVSTRRDGAAVEIRVADTGGGVPAAVRERIFDPFFTTKPVGRGSGQGLALARAIVVDRHGGQLTFETQMGLGTTFCIRLPIDGVRDEVAA